MQLVTALLFGEGPLALSCAQELLDRGHRIQGIASSDAGLVNWARSNQIPVAENPSDWRKFEGGPRPDILLNVAALRILPQDLVELPRIAAVNFHDGPLPRYAGLFGPNWAILNGEREFGVCWHEMRKPTSDAPNFDSGPILAEEAVSILDGESVWSLDVRCFEAGVRSFSRLLGQFESEATEAHPQDFANRSVFRRFERPAGAGFLDWSGSAIELAALCRACDYGRQPNPFLSAKIQAGEGWWVVERAEPGASIASVEHGQIVHADSSGVQIACQEGSLWIRGLKDQAGGLLTPEDWLQACGLEVGDRLPLADACQIETRSDEIQQLLEAESEWLTWFRCLPDELPLLAPGMSAPADPIAAPSWQQACALFLEQLQQSCNGQDLVVGLQSCHPNAAHLPELQEPICPVYLPAACDAAAIEERIVQCDARGPLARDLEARFPQQSIRLSRTAKGDRSFAVLCIVCDDPSAVELPLDCQLAFAVRHDGTRSQIHQPARVHKALPDDQTAWNSTQGELPEDETIVSAWIKQVQAAPHAQALRCRLESLSFAQLDARVERFATRLIAKGVGPGARIGIYLERSAEMIVAVLASLRVGAAYVPLDPEFPVSRVEFIARDAGLAALVTRAEDAERAPCPELLHVLVEATSEAEGCEESEAVSPTISDHLPRPESLAYVLYTSGSTGRPKGVEVEHRNVVNFFYGMDEAIGTPAGPFLAVSSLNFDISVLELLWTLVRGVEVVLYLGEETWTSEAVSAPSRELEFGLFFWGASGNAPRPPGTTPYDFFLDAARFADANGFSAVWTPERHFHDFGGLFPNPQITSAALSTITKRIQIRSGSTVAPLHSPVRLAEDLAVIDQLSSGRVGLAMASGWAPNDFVILRDHYANRKQRTFEVIDQVRAFWRGDSVELENGVGEMVEICTQPRPVQESLPIWLTAATSPETFIQAGRLGCHLLTHLLGQDIQELSDKITLYRNAWDEAGHAGRGTVSLMLHTFVGRDDEHARSVARDPMKGYLTTAISLVEKCAWAWPATKHDMNLGDGRFEISDLSESEQEALLEFAFERYFGASGLFGSVETCVAMAHKVAAVDVDEIGCLIDYGVDPELMMESLPRLAEVLSRANLPRQQRFDGSILAQLRDGGIRSMQCTPSMAQMMVLDPATKRALSHLELLLVGGEALPASLARSLEDSVSGRVINLYGPTETTIWSTSYPLQGTDQRVSIGRPILNTQIYVLDGDGNPCQTGVAGELWIAGDGVARGYHNRPRLTAERFQSDPFSQQPGARMYRTGDLGSWAADGTLDFLGRVDSQVKLRGYRIELGEIEHALCETDGIAQAAAIIREDQPGDRRLAAYYTASSAAPPTPNEIRSSLRDSLPEYMVPQHFIRMESLPLTPNGKLDRKALLAHSTAPSIPEADASPSDQVHDQVQTHIAEIWAEILGVKRVGLDQNFFDLGGHSLLAVRLQIELKKQVSDKVSLVDVFRFPTVREFADHIRQGDDAVQTPNVESRAALRGAARRRSSQVRRPSEPSEPSE
jgi:natural product biosynthesis luciferase-like monooxygenase protein